MKYGIWMLAAAVSAGLLGGKATADTNLTLLPTAVNDGAAAAPSNDFAPGWGGGSWQANGTVLSHHYFSPTQLFGKAVNVGDIASISYWTNKDTAHTVSASDWFAQIYTPRQTGDGSTQWYGRRFTTEPYFASKLTETAGQWTQWSTSGIGNDQENRLRVFEGQNNTYFGSYTDGFLRDSTFQDSYGALPVLYFAVGTGKAWANGFTGNLDGMTIVLTDGTTANVNFEGAAVPLPSAAWAGLGLMGVLGMAKIVRRRPAQA